MSRMIPSARAVLFAGAAFASIGVSPARARRLVLMARRLAELPETRAAFDNGELCEDQVAVVCQHAPASVDAEAADLARSATVAMRATTSSSS